MSAIEQAAPLTQALQQPYRHGFVTEVETDSLPPGLDEDIVRAISKRKREPEFLLKWRLAAFERWQKMPMPEWGKLRIAPIYRDFFQKLGASVVQVAPGEVYTALDRGVVDGYGWPLIGIFDLGWQEKTKYRIDPGFYNIELSVIFNARSWQKLTPQQRQFLEKEAAWLESLNASYPGDGAAEDRRQRAAGIEVIKLDDAQAKLFLQIAYETAWDGVIKASPVHGAKLKQMLTKK